MSTYRDFLAEQLEDPEFGKEYEALKWMDEPSFRSSLTMDEIEENFKDVDLFSGIMEGLQEALDNERSLP